MSEKQKSVEDLTPPEEFYKIINDFSRIYWYYIKMVE